MTTKHKAKRVEDGYEYRGRFIHRTSNHSNAYNPWKVMGHRYGFATLADAKAWVDGREDNREGGNSQAQE